MSFFFFFGMRVCWLLMLYFQSIYIFFVVGQYLNISEKIQKYIYLREILIFQITYVYQFFFLILGGGGVCGGQCPTVGPSLVMELNTQINSYLNWHSVILKLFLQIDLKDNYVNFNNTYACVQLRNAFRIFVNGSFKVF